MRPKSIVIITIAIKITILEASIAGTICSFAIQPNQAWSAPEKSRNSTVISMKLIVANITRSLFNIKLSFRPKWRNLALQSIIYHFYKFFFTDYANAQLFRLLSFFRPHFFTGDHKIGFRRDGAGVFAAQIFDFLLDAVA